MQRATGTVKREGEVARHTTYYTTKVWWEIQIVQVKDVSWTSDPLAGNSRISSSALGVSSPHPREIDSRALRFSQEGPAAVPAPGATRLEDDLALH